MKHRSTFALVSVLAIALGAALTVMPARWLMAALPSELPVSVADADGSLWSGRALLAVGQPGFQRTITEPLAWTFSLVGGPHLRVEHPWLNEAVVIRPAWLGLSISGQSFQAPASLLSTFDARLAALNPGGQLLLQWPAMVVGFTGKLQNNALIQLHWNNASSTLAAVKPLGSYRLSLTASALEDAAITLSSAHGPLLLQGQGAISPGGRFQMGLTTRIDPVADPAVSAALRDLLATLGVSPSGTLNLRHS